jgi:hypothetical protein
MPIHDPYKDPAFYDLAEKQLVDSPLNARSMVVKNPRETFTELEQENQTLGERDYSLPPKMANIELVLRDHEAILVELIQNYKAAIGCVYCLTSLPVLGALASLDAAALLVQKDDRLRSLRRAREHQAYRTLKPFALDEISSRFAHGEEVSVRCVGVATQGSVRANMHHKFLVLGSFATVPTTVVNSYTGEQHVEQRRWFCPEAAWLGSFNFTWNASRSLESAMIVRDQEIARRLRDEFCAILEISEPLDWDSQHIKPEFWVWGPDEDEPPEDEPQDEDELPAVD